MRELLIATLNRGKREEIRALLADLPLRLITPADLRLELTVTEDGETYAENARKKALAFARRSGWPALADDSGLEVELLGGAPGLRSARYVPLPGATDADRRAHLLQNLQDKPRPWQARFRAAVAVAMPDGRVALAEGECRGEIIPQERGLHGFGYDPIFLFPELGRTMAELSLEEKNRLSHRAQAVTRLRPLLKQLLGLET